MDKYSTWYGRSTTSLGILVLLDYGTIPLYEPNLKGLELLSRTGLHHLGLQGAHLLGRERLQGLLNQGISRQGWHLILVAGQ